MLRQACWLACEKTERPNLAGRPWDAPGSLQQSKACDQVKFKRPFYLSLAGPFAHSRSSSVQRSDA